MSTINQEANLKNSVQIKQNNKRMSILKLNAFIYSYFAHLSTKEFNKSELQESILTVTHFIEWYEKNYHMPFYMNPIEVDLVLAYLDRYSNAKLKQRLTILKDFVTFTKKQRVLIPLR